jgi:hypothetical protein
VVRCGLPCDPPVGGHSCNGGMISRFRRAVCEYFTLRSAAGADCNGKIRDYLCRKSVLNGSRASPFQFRRFVGVPRVVVPTSRPAVFITKSPHTKSSNPGSMKFCPPGDFYKFSAGASTNQVA